ncbi:Crp/Fnr family transcriptional regulator [Chamaesiphon minutus]|uniref:cAMP-binding protein n=1 Tax=Chamaesiphon minutus (strain ATCC 27169 / PCC 6605) TaxID=1173020 RepID=K9UR80_CHAP6|nr:Crp/Fnr family transcriptional regulator [Chamaesiphon minutus]AFY96961.1 cAMP-binding protein [Chamaesiphon minutus PCC 6605]
MNVLNSKSLLMLLQGTIAYRDLVNGQTLFYQGDPAESVFVVESGKIRLAHFTQAGKVIQHYDAVAGESFAEAALFNSVYDCAAIAEIPSRVMVLSKEILFKTLEQQPTLAMEVMAQLAKRAHHLKVLLHLRSIRSPRERVLHYLQLIAQSNQVNLKRSFKDIAEEIGIAPEVFSRALSSLEQDGVISRSQRNIDLH